MKHLIFTSISVIFLLISCVKNNPAPCWIVISEWQLETNPNSIVNIGELRHDISNVQVFVNNELVGIFEVPCKIPVLNSGECNIRLYPVILNNGISATKKIYSFLEPMEIDTELIENSTVTINPITRYYANLQFWVEDFENAASSITQDLGSSVEIMTVSDQLIEDAYTGSKFGRILLSESSTSWVGYTNNQELVLPKGQEVYLEIDYHNTNRITSGLLGVGPSGNQTNPNVQLNPQSAEEVKWKKIYIDLREIVSGSNNTEYFELTFQALLDEEDTFGEINIDNVKVIHF